MFPAILCQPPQIEGRVANHIIKAYLRRIIADILIDQISLRVEERRHLECLGIQFTPVGVGFHRHYVEEVPHPAGEIRHQIIPF